ncbi:PKD domain-containing protein [Winogradskyella litoriviva]|uniref:PKD domain-containing protein n=1 Tax=Winogradskyella litoriviva TaxID=1220182 RepID=A0ABX2E4X7_9FLAO|nr:PKD domain-containing protein [Winogradskyella litoriviva]NRD23334.1 PKD domain-containing protein [Winogradskyella litoriviva]
MKTVKYIFSLCLVILLINSCVQDESSTDFVDTAVAPTNVLALFEVTQDNTGLVTITPTAEGAIGFNIYYGDDTVDPADINQGENTTHTYAEGTYTVTVVAFGPTGLETEITKELVVSFNPPENLVVTIENDEAVSKQVNVTASADNAISFSVDFGDGSELVTGNIDETVSHIYQEPGLYTIEVTAMGAAIETTSYTEVDFEVTAILQPLTSAPVQPSRSDSDVISIFSSSYTDVPDVNYFPDWGQASQGSGWALFDLGGDEMLQYINLSYQGIALADNTSVDVSAMEFLHLDVWTADAVTDIEISLINNASGTVTEAPITKALTPNSWTTIEIPVSDYTDQGLTVSEIFQMKLVGTPWAAGTVFVDNIYFWKAPSGTPTGVVGTWKLSSVAGALGVGPAVGDIGWWNCDDACVTERACYYDDQYIFNADGTFSNVLGADTWVEGWQGGSDSCGTPVAPHDGSGAATFVYDEGAGTITLNGTGAFLGIPKANNSGELSNPADAPASITYNATLSNFDTEMSVYIEAGSGVFWQFNFTKEGGVSSPLAGSWQLAPEAGALGVGPAPGDITWWSCDDVCVGDRACYYDDQYVFGSDGSFSNVLGAETWTEGWQGGGDSCGTPVAPHDGSAIATYDLDLDAGTLTINGVGAYIGLAKANNTGELADPADAPASIVYDITIIDSSTINVMVEAGSGVFWQYKLVKI